MRSPHRISLRPNAETRGKGWVWFGLAASVVLAGAYVVAATRRVTN